MRNPGVPEQQVTSTGWRIVGAPAVSLLSAAVSADAAPSDDPDDIVFAAAFRVRPRTGTNAIEPLLRAFDATLAPVRAGTGVIARASRFSDAASKFHSIAWRTATRDDLWIGDLCWRRVHPAIGGVALTDHIVIEERPTDVRLTVRTFARGGASALRGSVGAGQARSPLLSAAADATRLIFHGRPAEPRMLAASEIDGFISGVLLDEHRTIPVAVLAATEQDGYDVDPNELAAEMLGIATVYFLDEHKTSFNLTDGIGDKRLSCFWGALRIYQPGFTCADDGLSHPLLMRDRLTDPVVRSGLYGSLALAGCARVSPPAAIDQLTAPAPAAAPVASPTATRPADVPAPAPASTPAAPSPAVVAPAFTAALEASIRALTEQLAAFQKANVALMDEVVRLRTASVVRASSVGQVDRRLGQLERVIRDFITPPASAPQAASPEPSSVDEPPDMTLAHVVQQAMAAHSDALLVLDQAVRSAEDSPFEDVDRVAVILDAMAYIARQRQADALGQSLRDTFREFGIDYRGGITRNTSSRQRVQYTAHLPTGDVACEEHIAIGSSFDPRFCLRIYFTSRAPGEPRFVVGHVGRHFDVASTT